MSPFSSTKMRISESDMAGTQDLVWPANPSYDNPIHFISSTSSEVSGGVGALKVIFGAGQNPKTFKVLAKMGLPVMVSAK